MIDDERRRREEVAEELRRLGVRNILITAAEQGKLIEVRCEMPTCFCPDELGWRSFFEPVHMIDWMPTLDHIALKSEGGRKTLENSRLAHRFCNRVGYSTPDGPLPPKEQRRIDEARRRAIEARRSLDAREQR